MNDYNQLGILAGVVSLAAFTLYILSIKNGKTVNPSRSGWGIWALAGLVILLSYWESGARATIWVPAIFFLGPAVVFLMTWKYSKPGFDWLDTVCVVGAIVGVVVWQRTDDPLMWLLINLGVDFLGLLPTLKKAWMGEEDWISWTVMFLAIVLNFFAIERWEIEIWSQPFYMVVTGATVLVCIAWPRRKKHAAS